MASSLGAGCERPLEQPRGPLAVSGCYTVVRRGGLDLPHGFELDTTPAVGRDTAVVPVYRLIAHPGPDSTGRWAPEAWPLAGWEPLGDDSVLVIWSDLFSGVALRLAVRGDTLRGVGTPVRDVGPMGERPTPDAVLARRTPCDLAGIPPA